MPRPPSTPARCPLCREAFRNAQGHWETGPKKPYRVCFWEVEPACVRRCTQQAKPPAGSPDGESTLRCRTFLFHTCRVRPGADKAFQKPCFWLSHAPERTTVSGRTVMHKTGREKALPSTSAIPYNSSYHATFSFQSLLEIYGQIPTLSAIPRSMCLKTVALEVTFPVSPQSSNLSRRRSNNLE